MTHKEIDIWIELERAKFPSCPQGLGKSGGFAAAFFLVCYNCEPSYTIVLT